MSADPPAHPLRASEAAVFLDVDGTLLGFKDHPDDVVADPELRDLLARLQTATGGALALVSGRTIADLDRIMSPLVLPAAGTHGAEFRFADGRRETVDATALQGMRAALEPFVAAHSGLLLEDKGSAIAVHYRHAPDLRNHLAAFLENAVPEDLTILHGKMVAEVKSRSTSKGQAVERLMATPPFAGRVPLFVGDDRTDEHGFEVVNRLAGVSIKVGDGPTIAGCRLDDHQAVRAYLSELCAT